MSSNYSTMTSVINAKFKVENLDVLEEPKVMTIKVQGCLREASLTLYRFDPNKEVIFPFFGREKGLSRICDYVLLADYDDDLYVLLIELKHGKVEAKEQLNATECLISYIITSALRIKREIDRDKIHIRKIRISECRRQYTRKTKVGDLEYDENSYLDYPWDALHIRALLK